MTKPISEDKKLKKLVRLFEKENKHKRDYGRKVATNNKKKKSKKLASEIRRMRKTMTVKDIGDHIGIHEKSVYRILRKYPENVTTERVTSQGEKVTSLKPQKGNQSGEKESQNVTDGGQSKVRSVEQNVTTLDGKDTKKVTSQGGRVTDGCYIDPITRDVNPYINKKEVNNSINNSITHDPRELFSEIIQITTSWKFSTELFSLHDKLIDMFDLDSDISYSEENGKKLSLLIGGMKNVSRFEPTPGIKMLEAALNIPRL